MLCTFRWISAHILNSTLQVRQALFGQKVQPQSRTSARLGMHKCRGGSSIHAGWRAVASHSVRSTHLITPSRARGARQQPGPRARPGQLPRPPADARGRPPVRQLPTPPRHRLRRGQLAPPTLRVDGLRFGGCPPLPRPATRQHGCSTPQTARTANPSQLTSQEGRGASPKPSRPGWGGRSPHGVRGAQPHAVEPPEAAGGTPGDCPGGAMVGPLGGLFPPEVAHDFACKV